MLICTLGQGGQDSDLERRNVQRASIFGRLGYGSRNLSYAVPADCSSVLRLGSEPKVRLSTPLLRLAKT